MILDENVENYGCRQSKDKRWGIIPAVQLSIIGLSVSLTVDSHVALGASPDFAKKTNISCFDSHAFESES